MDSMMDALFAGTVLSSNYRLIAHSREQTLFPAPGHVGTYIQNLTPIDSQTRAAMSHLP